MSIKGYSYRLASGLIADKDFYKPISNASGEHVAKYKQYILDKHLPHAITEKTPFPSFQCCLWVSRLQSKMLGTWWFDL